MKYVDAKDIAVIVRKELKQRWPGTKFSVRTKRASMYAGVHVSWTDGPTEAEVNAVTRPLQSWSHMDNTDYMHSKTTDYGGETFHSGAKSISLSRDFSAEFLTRIANEVCAELGEDVPEIKAWDDGTAYVNSGQSTPVRGPCMYLSTAIRNRAATTSIATEACGECGHTHSPDRSYCDVIFYGAGGWHCMCDGTALEVAA